MNDYYNKSGDWFNIWNPDAENSGFKGFIQPRNADGSFFFDPRWDLNNVFRPDHCSPVFGHTDCFLVSNGGEFYEASSWEYTFYVPQDMARLVEAIGGPTTFRSVKLKTPNSVTPKLSQLPLRHILCGRFSCELSMISIEKSTQFDSQDIGDEPGFRQS